MLLKLTDYYPKEHCEELVLNERFYQYLPGDTWSTTDIFHNSDVIMSTMASQITSLTIVYSTVYSGTDDRNTLLK